LWTGGNLSGSWGEGHWGAAAWWDKWFGWASGTAVQDGASGCGPYAEGAHAWGSEDSKFNLSFRANHVISVHGANRFESILCLLQVDEGIHICGLFFRPDKIDLRSGIRTEWPRHIFGPISNIGSPEVRIYLNWNFLQGCVFVHDKRSGAKNGWLEVDPNRNSSDPNQHNPKCHLIQNMTRSKFNLTRTWIECFIYQVYEFGLKL